MTPGRSLPPPGHPQRFTIIAHGGFSVLGPIDGEELDAWLAALPLATSPVVLDLACGKGDLLVRMAVGLRASGRGVDHNGWFVADAREAAAAAGVADRVTFEEQDAVEAARLTPAASADLASCIGASGVFGGTAGALAVLARLARPSGLVFVGEGYWRIPPQAEWLDEFEIAPSEMADVEGTMALGRAAGLEPLEPLVAPLDAWDAYEHPYAEAIERWAADSPDDPDREAFLARAGFMRDTYVRWRRDAMGYGVFAFRVP